MCGIFGTVSKSWAGQAEAAASVIRHRGPDDYGSYRDGDLFLAHYRLAIQDLSSAGHQPMQTADGRYTVLLNGEIYNHYELRKELPSGIHYRSSCDAETLLYAFAEWREKAFCKLNGIFTAVLYDAQEKELFLVRDPFGVKPCYYLQADEGFAFAS
ncbi:MAG TPA: hypothetical protein VFX48_02850, partial [Saprospiraceae bacterium]|nr:hypothetical protein [Saprospiraceae bacterium]